MSSSSKSTHDYSRKLRRAILEPWRQSHNLLPSPPPNRNTPTCPSTINSSPSLSPPQNPSPNKITHLEMNLQQVINATNPSPLTSPCIPSPSLDQIKEGKKRSSVEEVFRKPEAAPHKSTFHRGPSPNAKITLRVGDDEVIFDVDQSIKIPSNEDDECYGIDDLDNTINAEAQELLVNDEPIVQEIAEPVKVEREHLYSASANEIKEKKPKLKDLPHHLEYPYLHGDKSFPIIISSELSDKDKRFFQIPIAPEDQKKTTFTCPYGTFAYQRMPFGLCNAPATFQRCMTAIFHDMVEDFMEVFMEDFSVFGFDIEIKDKRGAENLAVVHLSRLENPDLGTFTEEEIADEFPDEHLMVLKIELNNDEPCADYVNYLVAKSYL
ncbi:reverse transcriptase domain-containing protein [Tanacetum coccineum]